MTEINKAGDNHSIGHIDIPQGKFREQMDAVADALRQMAGDSEIEKGDVVNDPLNAPFVLYVNGYTGKDTYVSGAYSTKASNQEERLRRISAQRLVCGYTEAMPFATLERACTRRPSSPPTTTGRRAMYPSSRSRLSLPLVNTSSATVKAAVLLMSGVMT